MGAYIRGGTYHYSTSIFFFTAGPISGAGGGKKRGRELLSGEAYNQDFTVFCLNHVKAYCISTIS